MLRKSKILVVLSLVLMLFLIAGGVVLAETKVTILMGTDKMRVKHVEEAVEIVKQKHPDWNIEIETPPDAELVFLASMGAGSGPDIFHVDTFKIPAFVEAHYLQDLSANVENWLDWLQYPDSMKGIVSYKNKPYAVVWDTDVRVLYYRKDLFAKAGLPTDWQPKNWDDILTAARELKKSGVSYPIVGPMGRNWDEGCTFQNFFMFLWGADGKLYDWDKEEWVVKSQAYLDTLNFYKTLHDEELIPKELPTEPRPWDIAYTYFSNKKAAILIDGSWVWGEVFAKGRTYAVPNVDETVGYALIPKKDGTGFITGAGGWSWAITAQAKDKEATWEVFKEICGENITAKYCTESAHVAPRKDVAEDPAYKAHKFLSWCVSEVLPYAKFRPALTVYPKVSLQIQLMVEKVASGEMSPEEALDNYAKTVSLLVGQ